MENQVAEIKPTLMRRTASFSILFVLGTMLIYLAFSMQSVALFWQIVLIGFGVLILLLADRMRRATSLSIIMTEEGLYESTGHEICRIEDITGIDRGALAFKPSNGFLIRTRKPGPFGWAPGLWWRLGRSIGVGGATPAGQAKFMSEMLAMRVAQAQLDSEKRD